MKSLLLLACGSVLLAQQYVISTYAGGAPPATPSPATAGSIGMPLSVAADATGNVYFASTDLNCVFKLSPSGILTRVAGSSQLGYSGDGGPAISARLKLTFGNASSIPAGVTLDQAGNLFIADTENHRIRKVSPDGIITTVAGNGTQGFGGDGGPAVDARLNWPWGVAVDGAGNLFIADAVNFVVRKVSPTGIITTVAGGGTDLGDGGPATSAQLAAWAVAADRTGNLFIADNNTGGRPSRIRKVSPSGIITTVAQIGVWGMAVDAAGDLLVADWGNRIRRISANGSITTVAGNGTIGFSGDGELAVNAQLAHPSGVAIDGAGNLFIADRVNNRIRKISRGATITTVAGDGTGRGIFGMNGVTAADDGPATSSQLAYPSSVAADNAGNVFIADTRNNRIRRVSPDGIMTTVAGSGARGFSGDGGPAIDAHLQWPSGLALDRAGNLFFGDGGTRVRKVSAGGIITTVAGDGKPDFPRGFVDGVPATSTAVSVLGVAVDEAGNLFIADGAYNRIRKVSSEGIINTVAGGGTDLGDGGPATKAHLSSPRDIVVDRGGNLLIADANYARIRKVSPSGIITTVAGGGAFDGPSGDGGPATSARLSAPAGLALDSAGNLFIADPGSDFLTGGETGLEPCCDSRIRKISPDGIITAVAGTGTPGFSGDGGPASTAALCGPLGMAVDGAGNVYVADSCNGVVRVLRPTGHSLLIGGVVDAANPGAGAVSPGKIVVIYGVGLGPVQLIENRASNATLGTVLSGTAVSLNGIAAPILYTSATQIAAVVPYGLAGTTAKVVVTYQGHASNEFTVTGAAASPSLFTLNQEGWGPAAAINAADGTVNTAANPVPVGGYISLFATGEGQTSPGGMDGRLGGSAPTNPVLPVSAMVGGLPARIQFAGGVQGQIAGLMQVNVMIPDGVQPGGYVPVVLRMGDRTSSPAVWIGVR